MKQTAKTPKKPAVKPEQSVKIAATAATSPPQNDTKAAETTPKRLAPPAWFWSLLALGMVLYAGSAALAISHKVPGIERHIFHAINGWRGGHLMTQLAKQLSNAVWGMVGLCGLLLLVPKFRLRAWQYAVAAGGAYTAVFVTEHIINRARPELLFPHEAIIRATQGGPGYPSGHMATLTALGLTLWLFVRWPWRVFIVLLLAAEAWARIFLGVHTPLDIAGGVGIGLTAVAVLHLAPIKWRHFFKLA